MTTPLTLDNTDPPSNRTTAASLAFTNQKVRIALSRNFNFAPYRADFRDVQGYDSDGMTAIPTTIVGHSTTGVGIRYVGKVAMPTGNATTYGPYVQCENVRVTDLGLANPPHTLYGASTQAAYPAYSSNQEGILTCIDKNNSELFTYKLPLEDGLNSLDVGDVDGDGIPEILVGGYHQSGRLYCLKAADRSVLWSHQLSALANTYIRFGRVGKLRGDVPNNQVVMGGGIGGGLLTSTLICLDGAGNVLWTATIAQGAAANPTIQDALIEDLDGAGAAVYFGHGPEIQRYDSIGSHAWTYTHSGTRNFYGLVAGHFTSTTEKQIAAISAYAPSDPTTGIYQGVLVVVDKSGNLVAEREFPLFTYGVAAYDIDGDGYKELIVNAGADTGGASLHVYPPLQGWGMLYVLDRNLDVIASHSLTCAAKVLEVGNFDGTGALQVQTAGDDGWLHRFAIDSGYRSATVQVTVPSVAWKETRTLYLGSTGSATRPPLGDFYFDLTGADGSTPPDMTARNGSWSIQSGWLQSHDDGDAGNDGAIEAALSTEAFELQFDAVKMAQGTGTAFDYYVGVLCGVTTWSGGLSDGYMILIGAKGHWWVQRKVAGSATTAYTAASGTSSVTFGTTDVMSFRVVRIGQWFSATASKNGGPWKPVLLVQDTNVSSSLTAGSVCLYNQRGQSKYQNISILEYLHSDGNAGPGPVPMAYLSSPPGGYPATFRRRRLILAGAY